MNQRYPEVNQMAAYILAHPTATARDIATELKYSQPRSVYYWLRKAGFSGLTSFRTAVLTGAYPVTAYAEGPFKPRASRVAEVPLSSDIGDANGADDYIVTTQAVGRGAFALTVTSDQYVPLFERNDIVIIDPDEHVLDGDLVALKGVDGQNVFGRAYTGRRPLYIHPTSGRPIEPAAPAQRVRVLGKIVGMQRSF